MNGNSSAHQASPIAGTQINWCLRKNLSRGMRRFSRCCSTKMSTHDWWLQLTRYQLRGVSPSTPCTSHTVRWVRAIQALLPEIQASAMRSKTGSIKSRTFLSGIVSFTTETSSRMGTQNRAFNTISSVATTPTRTGGKKYNMAMTFTLKFLSGSIYGSKRAPSNNNYLFPILRL